MELNVQLILLEFLGGLGVVLFSIKMMSRKKSVVEYKPKHLDPIFIKQSPSIALGQAKEEILRMGQFAVRGLEETSHFLMAKHKKFADSANEIVGTINHLDRNITDYLDDLTTSPLSGQDSEEHTSLLKIERDIKRIGDHFASIIELVEYQLAGKVIMTDAALDDLKEMFSLTIDAVQDSLRALDQNDEKAAQHVVQNKEEIGKLERTLRKQHILRLNEGLCSRNAGIVYAEILSSLERIRAHAVYIAETVLGKYSKNSQAPAISIFEKGS